MNKYKDDPKAIAERANLLAEMKKQLIPKFSFEHYKKTADERCEIRNIISIHNRELRKYGLNPRKRMNKSLPQKITL